MDVTNQLAAIHREVSSQKVLEKDCVVVSLRRDFEAPIGEVWTAITDPDELQRWFLPVEGDLNEGGSFQVKGNASGGILRCDPPGQLRITFGAEASVVDVRLSSSGEQTTFELAHTMPFELTGGLTGSVAIGPGWDSALLGLGLFLQGELIYNPEAAGNSEDAQEFAKGAAHAWADVLRATGKVADNEVDEALKASMRHFAPDAQGSPES